MTIKEGRVNASRLKNEFHSTGFIITKVENGYLVIRNGNPNPEMKYIAKDRNEILEIVGRILPK